MRFIRAFLAVGVASSPVPASAQYTFEQQQACMQDAFRLCSAFIPDQAAITHCMALKRRLLSPGCRVVFNRAKPAPGPSYGYGGTPYPTPSYTPYNAGSGGYWPGGDRPSNY